MFSSEFHRQRHIEENIASNVYRNILTQNIILHLKYTF